MRRIKIRDGQKLPPGWWDEVIVAMGDGGDRIATPAYVPETEYNALRNRVKSFIRKGCRKWEAGDLAALRMLKSLGIDDITADWTLYAFNSRALRALSALGVKRFVASPENSRENLMYLAGSGYAVEFLSQQSTPLFISRVKPAAQEDFAVFERDGLYVTTRRTPREFFVPEGADERVDLSWSPE